VTRIGGELTGGHGRRREQTDQATEDAIGKKWAARPLGQGGCRLGPAVPARATNVQPTAPPGATTSAGGWVRTVSVTLRDARSTSGDREWIRAAYRDYLSELSLAKTGLFPVLGEWDAREGEILAGWFDDPSAQPFVILQSGTRAGFALVARPALRSPTGAHFRMADFFVVRNARRRGVGASAATLIFSRFAGEWEVLEDPNNRQALQFWRRVIGRVTAGRYSESAVAGEVRHRFRVDSRPSARDA